MWNTSSLWFLFNNDIRYSYFKHRVTYGPSSNLTRFLFCMATCLRAMIIRPTSVSFSKKFLQLFTMPRLTSALSHWSVKCSKCTSILPSGLSSHSMSSSSHSQTLGAPVCCKAIYMAFSLATEVTLPIWTGHLFSHFISRIFQKYWSGLHSWHLFWGTLFICSKSPLGQCNS